jgi:membrane protease YdiL (CAAX protease family)
VDILSFFVLFSLIAALFLTVRYWRLFKGNVQWIAPYTFASMLLVMATGAADAGRGVALDENIGAIVSNMVEVLRNSFFAIVGYTVFSLENSVKPLRPWDDGLRFLAKVPLRFTLTVIIGYCVYSQVLLYIFAPEIFQHKLIGIFPQLSLVSLSVLTAINEELLFRMFLMGLTFWLLHRFTFRWPIAVAVSAIIWGYSHWFIGGLGWVKFMHVLPFGVVLGYTLKRYGFETCVFLHLLANVVNVLFAQWL